MTPADVKRIREALSDASGRHVSQRDLAQLLGLNGANAGDTVRSWEDGSKDVSGPASVALKYLSKGLPGFRGDLPEWSYQAHFHHRGQTSMADLITRYWWPRMIVMVDRSSGRSRTGTIHWLDEPGDNRQATIDACAKAFALDGNLGAELIRIANERAAKKAD